MLAALPRPAALAADEPANKSRSAAERYVLDFPAAAGFCPPVENYFNDVSQTIQEVGDDLISHQPNGGYGLPVILKRDGKNLIHLGADVAFHRPGEPVFAIAAGVVRTSAGPALSPPGSPATDRAKAAAKPLGSEWGNLIVIEHRLPDGSFVTSIYGHLARRRLVAAGDVVAAGQMIGAIGKSGIENGGYKPHLHFGIRTGRLAEPGAEIFASVFAGQKAAIRLVALDENEVEVAVDEAIPLPFTLQLAGREFTIASRGGKQWLAAAALYCVQRPDFRIVGYGLTTEGWRDPTEFLHQMRADTQPVPLRRSSPASKKAAPKAAITR
ncbi:MAG TPA: M23 family metallopeptidase [Pirellulales bacterium]|nr:M23 family metallopeptidase [Pirellulales bacterium]